MANKKFLQENNKQIWPITRADCIYTVAGDKLLSDDYASKEYVDDKTFVLPTRAMIDIILESDTHTSLVDYSDYNINLFDKPVSDVVLYDYDTVLFLELKRNDSVEIFELNVESDVWGGYTYSGENINGETKTKASFSSMYEIYDPNGGGWGGYSQVNGLNLKITDTVGNTSTTYVLGENDTVKISKYGYENLIGSHLIGSVEWDTIKNVPVLIKNIEEEKSYALQDTEYYSLMDGYNLADLNLSVNEVHPDYEGDTTKENAWHGIMPYQISLKQNAGWKGIHIENINNLDGYNINKVERLSGRASYCKIKVITVLHYMDSNNNMHQQTFEADIDASKVLSKDFYINTNLEYAISGLQRKELWILFNTTSYSGRVEHLRLSAIGNVGSVADGTMLNWESMRKHVDNAIQENRFSGDYNDLENIPCYDDYVTVEYTYDGNPVGKTLISAGLVKVSDDVVSYEEFKTATIAFYYTGYDETITYDMSSKTEGIDYFLSDDGLFLYSDFVVIVYEDNVTFRGITFPHKGIYFYDSEIIVNSSSNVNAKVMVTGYACSLSVNRKELKQLDEKFIPDTIARVENLPYCDTRTTEPAIITYDGYYPDKQIAVLNEMTRQIQCFVRIHDSLSLDEVSDIIAIKTNGNDEKIENLIVTKYNEEATLIKKVDSPLPTYLLNIKSDTVLNISDFITAPFSTGEFSLSEGLWVFHIAVKQESAESLSLKENNEVNVKALGEHYICEVEYNKVTKGNVKRVDGQDYLTTKKYVDEAIQENGFSGDYNDLENKPCYIVNETELFRISLADLKSNIETAIANKVNYFMINMDIFPVEMDKYYYLSFNGHELVPNYKDEHPELYFYINDNDDESIHDINISFYGKNSWVNNDWETDETKTLVEIIFTKWRTNEDTVGYDDIKNEILNYYTDDIVLIEREKVTLSNDLLDKDLKIENSLSMLREGSIGTHSVALGEGCTATGSESFAMGSGNIALGASSSALGVRTKASAHSSLAEGNSTTANGYASHAEGHGSIANGVVSHAEGSNTIASSMYQHVQGRFNIEDTANKYAHIVGNGYNDTRSNAHTLDWDGNAWFQGNVSIDGVPTNDNDLVTKKYVDDVVANATPAIITEEDINAIIADIDN